MDDGPPPKKGPDSPPAIPAPDRPAMEAGAPPVPLPPAGSPSLPPADRPALAPAAREAIAPADRPALAPADIRAIAPGPAPASLPESGQPALQAGAPAEPDPLGDDIETILRSARTIAVVGASDKPGKPSHRVAFYLMHAGFDVYLVNPTLKDLGGRPVYPDLHAVPVKLDIVDIFRRPEQVRPVVEEAIAVGARAVWMQEGVVNEEAAAAARAAGLRVVMDRCVMKEHRRMTSPAPYRPRQRTRLDGGGAP